MVYQILVTLHLHRTVASDALVMVALDGVVESIDAYVQNPVRHILVLMYKFVHRTRLVCGIEIARSNEMTLVEVSLVHTEKVEEHHKGDGNGNNGHPAFGCKRFLCHISPLDESKHNRNQQERP